MSKKCKYCGTTKAHDWTKHPAKSLCENCPIHCEKVEQEPCRLTTKITTKKNDFTTDRR